MEKPPLKAFGRSLSDFNNLTPAEKMLLDACRKGEIAQISDSGQRPEQATLKNLMRSSFLRFLALGGDEQNPVHENGVMLSGAWLVEDELNLMGATLPHSLRLINCRLNTIILCYSNVHGFVSFEGCHVESLQGDFMVCSSDVFLNASFTATGTVSFTSAQITGSLDCSNAKFSDARSGKQHVGALVCDGATLGHVHLNNGFSSIGTVRFLSVQIGGDLECDNSKFNGNGSDALLCSGAVIKGSVILISEFIGTVCLSGAQIGFYLKCSGTTFDGTNSITSDCPSGLALRAENMTVAGIFFFKNLKSVKGAISLMTAKVGTLEDDIKSWSQGNLALDGFVYDRLAGSAPTEATNRLAWLNKQFSLHAGLELFEGKGNGFRQQPWQQLQKVLREMGHIEDARQVGIAFEDRLRKANLIGQTNCYQPIAWIYGSGSNL